jgi:hypothetical protein
MTPFDESQKLVRCDVINRYNEASTRLIEISAFKLWEYLMTHKHGLSVSNPSLCLWLSAVEYEENEAIFDHAGYVEPVDRILLDLFDAKYGFSHTSVRYARSSETEQLVKILRSHVPEELRNSEACSVDVVPGMVVQQWTSYIERPMIIGLEP